MSKFVGKKEKLDERLSFFSYMKDGRNHCSYMQKFILIWKRHVSIEKGPQKSNQVRAQVLPPGKNVPN